MQISSGKNISATSFTQTLKTKNNKEKFNSNTQYSYPRGILASNYGILLKKADKTTFKGRKLRNASDVEKLLSEMGIKSSFKGSALVADCSYKMAKVFERYFGKKSLPREINFLSFKEDDPSEETDSTLGWFKPLNHAVEFNKDQDCYGSRTKLKTRSLSDRYGSIFTSGAPFDSTSSYLSTFFHEMGHCAHHQRILDTSRTYSFADKCWKTLSNKTVPKGIGKIMTKWKLGLYATGEYGGGLCEHMANRIARDICNNYDSDYELYEGDEDDLKYADIFDRKWGKLDPLHPQSYLDFYDQQIWNAGVGGYIGEDGEYHNLKIKEAEEKANEFIEMAEKIAKKEGIKVEDVDLYKVKEFSNNPQKAKEYFEKKENYDDSMWEVKLLSQIAEHVLEDTRTNKNTQSYYNDSDKDKRVMEITQKAMLCISSMFSDDSLSSEKEEESDNLYSEDVSHNEQTSIFDHISSWFTDRTPQQHQQERQQKHMLF